VEEFEAGTVDVFVHGALSVGGLWAFLKLGLPTRGRSEIGGERVGLSVGDVPDELVFLIPHNAHGIIHLDFVEGVGGENGVPVFRFWFAKNGDPGLAVVAAEIMSSGAVFRGGVGFAFPELLGGDPLAWPVDLGVEAAGEIEEGGGDVEEEGLFVVFGEEGLAGLGHCYRIAGITFQGSVEVKDLFGGDVILPDAGGAVAFVGEDAWQREAGDIVEGREFVEMVGVAVLAILVVVEPG